MKMSAKSNRDVACVEGKKGLLWFLAMIFVDKEDYCW